MSRIALIACSSSKSVVDAPARDFYTGTLFRKSAQFAERTCDDWAVLSAKHGLVRRHQRLYPYDETLSDKTLSERRAWAQRVFQEIDAAWPIQSEPHTFVLLAGANYRAGLVEALSACPSVIVDIPMQGLGIGKQLQWLAKENGAPKSSTP
jgi:hypothetical protein